MTIFQASGDSAPVALPTIRTIILQWRAAERARTGISRILQVLVSVFVISFVLGALQRSGLLVSIAVVIGFLSWCYFEDNWGHRFNVAAPDKLLLELANHDAISLPVKKEIAAEILRDGQVTYGFLYKLSDRLREDSIRAALGEGHVQMLKVAEVDREIGEA